LRVKRATKLLDPDTKKILLTLNIYSDGKVTGFIMNTTIITDLHPDYINENIG
jgi:hypothetical protein